MVMWPLLWSSVALTVVVTSAAGPAAKRWMKHLLYEATWPTIARNRSRENRSFYILHPERPPCRSASEFPVPCSSMTGMGARGTPGTKNRLTKIGSGDAPTG